jgi:5-hydroxyisourate hydrolase
MPAPITTHILDTRLGIPAAGVRVHLEQADSQGGWRLVGSAVSGKDGRISDLPEVDPTFSSRCRLRFETGAYFESQRVECFFPQIGVEFELSPSAGHCHVPLLLSPFGYSAYRGS